MRQGQQNRRGRGRSHNNHQGRKGQNPLTRTFESNGPDVKIRGTPSHVAEKYMTLARDALSSGDPVLAENYLQHAEHYNRIIMAYREQQIAQGGEFAQGGQNGMARPQRFAGPGEGHGDDFDEGEGEDFGQDGQPQPVLRGQEPQPRTGEPQRYDDRGHRQSDQPSRPYQQQQHHPRDRDRHGGRRDFQPDRGERGERFERQDRDRYERAEAGERQGGERQPQGESGPRHRERGDRDRMAPSHEQPEFLRRPVRRPRRDDEPATAAEAAPASSGSGEDRD